MPLSWNEIRERALRFSKEWENETSENAESKSFLDDFFDVFGVQRRRVATFEKKIKKIDNKDGFIDLLWPGKIIIEMKSTGNDLNKAYSQAIDYFPGLKDAELPKYILVCDFLRFRLYDLEENTQNEFSLNEFIDHVHLFGDLAGYTKKIFKDEDPVNIEAAELMGKLHDRLKEIGYEGHRLEIYLVRLLFCLFAEDTGIFEKKLFEEYIINRTNPDGSDLAAHISLIFDTLSTPPEKRFKNIDESLNLFPFVNGKLFDEMLSPASFDSKMRSILLECSALDWSKISPAIFGSLFQSVMNPEIRRNLGAHYTSEKNILKVIKPLFIDDLRKQFESVKKNRVRLIEFHNSLKLLRFLDPACGCGNFLIISYRELRQLELEILRELYQYGEDVLDIALLTNIEVDQFYGIEIEEFPARIAEVAMWLMDHQMNMRLSEEFGQYFVKLPLKKAANITFGNALQLDWENIIPNKYISYILGNPPFSGKHLQNEEQKRDMKLIFDNMEGKGVLDYVTAWYMKAAAYIQGTKIKVAFVSTNSISQGEQVGVLWNILLNKYKIKIHFAHKTFKWSNEARGKAAVYCIIIGFANFNNIDKYIYEYNDIKGEPHEVKVKNINPYLVDSSDILIFSRNLPICNVPSMLKGSQPTDGGNLLLSSEEKLKFLEKEPNAIDWIRPFISAEEFLNNKQRWCLWLVNITPNELSNMPYVLKRIEKVRLFRLNSKKETTVKFAQMPSLFTEIRQPKDNYIIVPRVSSENRKYIPFDFHEPFDIISDTCIAIPKANIYHFGILTSEMHMTWVRYICGRLKSDYRYSNTIVYNNFPWPINPNKKQIPKVEESARKILEIRKKYQEPETHIKASSLAELYDTLTMPHDLLKAHKELDKAVDQCYRSQPFPNDAKRMEFLFELYENYTSPLIAGLNKQKRKTL